MSDDIKWVTIWHQPKDMPILGTVEEILEALTLAKVQHKTAESTQIKDHIAISVPSYSVKFASKFIEKNFGRRT